MFSTLRPYQFVMFCFTSTVGPSLLKQLLNVNLWAWLLTRDSKHKITTGHVSCFSDQVSCIAFTSLYIAIVNVLMVSHNFIMKFIHTFTNIILPPRSLLQLSY